MLLDDRNIWSPKRRKKNLSCYTFTVNHGFTGLIALIKQLFHIRSKVSQNETKKIKVMILIKYSSSAKQCSSSETFAVATIHDQSGIHFQPGSVMFKTSPPPIPIQPPHRGGIWINDRSVLTILLYLFLTCFNKKI